MQKPRLLFHQPNINWTIFNGPSFISAMIVYTTTTHSSYLLEQETEKSKKKKKRKTQNKQKSAKYENSTTAGELWKSN